MLDARALVLALAVLAAGCSAYGSAAGRVVLDNGNARISISINERDREFIGRYYAEHRKALPPGLAKRAGRLPPGLAKRDRLPPGLAKRDRLPPGLDYEPLPEALERRLEPLPDGYIRVRVGADVVLLEQRSRVVFDIVKSVAL